MIENEIQELRRSQQITDFGLSSLIQHNFQSDIFIVAKEGKFSNLRYLIEKEGVDISKTAEKDYDDETIYKGDSILHIATKKRLSSNCSISH